MAHFCKLDENNVVIETIAVANEVLLDENNIEQEQNGIDFLVEWSGGHTNWKQTSYNTQAGVHILGGTPFRKNYATTGFTYDPERDAFLPYKEFPSHSLNEETCRWEAPTPMPEVENGSDIVYRWDEPTLSWVLTDS